MRTADICPTCATFTNALCVLYDGTTLPNTQINNLDPLSTALSKIDSTLVPKHGTTTPSANAGYIGQLYINSTIPSLYYAKSSGSGAGDWKQVSTILGVETLTNKTLTSPIINNATYVGLTDASVHSTTSSITLNNNDQIDLITTFTFGTPSDDSTGSFFLPSSAFIGQKFVVYNIGNVNDGNSFTINSANGTGNTLYRAFVGPLSDASDVSIDVYPDETITLVYVDEEAWQYSVAPTDIDATRLQTIDNLSTNITTETTPNSKYPSVQATRNYVQTSLHSTTSTISPTNDPTALTTSFTLVDPPDGGATLTLPVSPFIGQKYVVYNIGDIENDYTFTVNSADGTGNTLHKALVGTNSAASDVSLDVHPNQVITLTYISTNFWLYKVETVDSWI